MAMAKRQDLTAERARELFSYDKETGLLTRRITVNYNAKAGDIAGCDHIGEYLSVGADGERYLAHRIIYLLVAGEWPEEIDHINGDGYDNRWVNIRNVDRATNHKNQKLRSTNTSGLMGVCWDKGRGKWAARIRVNYLHINLGRFDDWFEAVCARKSAENKYGFHINHGRSI